LSRAARVLRVKACHRKGEAEGSEEGKSLRSMLARFRVIRGNKLRKAFTVIEQNFDISVARAELMLNFHVNFKGGESNRSNILKGFYFTEIHGDRQQSKDQ
jgi:hypothetical protein